MAPPWLSLLMGLLSFPMADSLKLPRLWLLMRDRPKVGEVPALSRWNEAGHAARGFPSLARMKREDKMAPKHPLEVVTNCCIESSTVAETPSEGTLMEKHVSVTQTSMESTTEPSTDTSASLTLHEETSSEAAGTTEVALTQETTPLVSRNSTHRVDNKVGPSMPPPGTGVSQDKRRLRTDMDSTSPQRTSRTEKALQSFNMTSAPALATSSVATATLRHTSSGAGPGSKSKLPPAITMLRSPTLTTRPQQMDPSSGGLPGATTTTILVQKCLLGIFLLALVAGIFVITTAVLAAMLWRQKRAYKINLRNNPTEMICISSLLAAEEAEAMAERKPKRVMMMLGGSETEIDNLTLNSFLPEH